MRLQKISAERKNSNHGRNCRNQESAPNFESVPSWSESLTAVTFQCGDDLVSVITDLQNCDVGRIIADEHVFGRDVKSRDASQGIADEEEMVNG